mmetsp:Transcript_28875/g.46908  ORF Transcript_28875/g.46908 Transcript_28875/m.46908 type:complete len:101 (+) Transcript_28875:176-478(+)
MRLDYPLFLYGLFDLRNYILCIFSLNLPNFTHFILENDTVKFVCVLKKFRSKGSGDELSRAALLTNHICNSPPIDGIQVRVNFVEEIKRRWIASLYSKDE